MQQGTRGYSWADHVPGKQNGLFSNNFPMAEMMHNPAAGTQFLQANYLPAYNPTYNWVLDHHTPATAMQIDVNPATATLLSQMSEATLRSVNTSHLSLHSQNFKMIDVPPEKHLIESLNDLNINEDLLVDKILEVLDAYLKKHSILSAVDLPNLATAYWRGLTRIKPEDLLEPGNKAISKVKASALHRLLTCYVTFFKQYRTWISSGDQRASSINPFCHCTIEKLQTLPDNEVERLGQCIVYVLSILEPTTDPISAFRKLAELYEILTWLLKICEAKPRFSCHLYPLYNLFLQCLTHTRNCLDPRSCMTLKPYVLDCCFRLLYFCLRVCEDKNKLNFANSVSAQYLLEVFAWSCEQIVKDVQIRSVRFESPWEPLTRITGRIITYSAEYSGDKCFWLKQEAINLLLHSSKLLPSNLTGQQTKVRVVRILCHLSRHSDSISKLNLNEAATFVLNTLMSWVYQYTPADFKTFKLMAVCQWNSLINSATEFLRNVCSYNLLLRKCFITQMPKSTLPMQFIIELATNFRQFAINLCHQKNDPRASKCYVAFLENCIGLLCSLSVDADSNIAIDALNNSDQIFSLFAPCLFPEAPFETLKDNCCLRIMEAWNRCIQPPTHVPLLPRDAECPSLTLCVLQFFIYNIRDPTLSKDDKTQRELKEAVDILAKLAQTEHCDIIENNLIRKQNEWSPFRCLRDDVKSEFICLLLLKFISTCVQHCARLREAWSENDGNIQVIRQCNSESNTEFQEYVKIISEYLTPFSTTISDQPSYVLDPFSIMS